MLTIRRKSIKSRPTKRSSPEDRLVSALNAVHEDFAVSRKMFTGFMQGMCYGLGFIIAVAIIIPVVLFALRRVDFPPIIATFVEDVIEQMERR